jgi:hypothetical protein
MEEKQAVAALAALAQEHRLAVFRLLVKEARAALRQAKLRIGSVFRRQRFHITLPTWSAPGCSGHGGFSATFSMLLMWKEPGA